MFKKEKISRKKWLKELVLSLVSEKELSRARLMKIKNSWAGQVGFNLPTNIELLKVYHELFLKKQIKKSENLEKVLRTRPIRSLSGIVNVSVLTKPFQCPGKCLYCPFVADLPKSYLPKEPAVARATKLDFDPFLQVQERLEMLRLEGHPVDKVDLRVIGGTWSFYPKAYQTWFVKRCFDACNQVYSSSLKKAQEYNDKFAQSKMVGISVETRPDFIDEKEILRLRFLGVTRVELGVQSLDDKILELNRRGHKVEATIKATQLLKQAGFKICYQMMPNLMGSNIRKDEAIFKELFENQDFQPDYLKIYPCVVLKEAHLYEDWLKGRHRAYTNQETKYLIKRIKKNIPSYVRIQRIIRDIPKEYIVAGCDISNLRQEINREMVSEGWHCQCIRCREIGADFNSREKIYLFRKDYEASKGKEIFLSFENKDQTKLFSFLRLRLNFENNDYLPVLSGSGIIREIQTVGQSVELGGLQVSPQHRGLGKRLIFEAFKITKKEFGLKSLAVIAGIGARGYFRKFGFKLKQTYLVKKI